MLIQIPVAVTKLQRPVRVQSRHSTVPIGLETTPTQTQQGGQHAGHVNSQFTRVVASLDPLERRLKRIEVGRIRLSQDSRTSTSDSQLGHGSPDHHE